MKKVIIPVVILIAFVAIPMLALTLLEKEYKSKPRGVPVKSETGQAFADKVRIQGGEHMVRFGSKKIAEILPKYQKDNKNLDILASLVHHYNSLAKGYNQLREYEKAKEPRAKSLQYLAEYEQAMEKAWPERTEKIADSNMLKIINYYIHINPIEEKEMYWKQKWLDLNLEKWNRGEKTYAVAHWIMSMYSSQHKFDPETGRQETMPQILKWEQEMRRIGKPENYSRGQPW